ncbi:MAG: 2Fe-2S iron-sulfur cluster binding domain-containing protein [Sulfuritalea sp.]|nr:2Fe-2S iron-sulfur cluster binding domain-containing protein [Sulfuritalea sp.]
MNSLSLLSLIVLGLAVQVGLYLGIVFWRHWRDYQALRGRDEELKLPPPRLVPEGDEPAAPAWQGFRSFRVERKVFEDILQSVCSFHLVPEDGQALPGFLPGQFLTFRFDVPTANGSTEQIIRCYSLSDAPRAEGYRISVKRVLAPAGSGLPPGRASGFLHDHVEVGSRLALRAPSGHFRIDRSDAPVVLIGGGIGITPMLSMANWCLAEQPGREVWLFYGVRNSREMIMKPALEGLAAAHPNFNLRVCFSNPLPEDVAVRDYQHQSRVDLNVLRMQLPLKTYQFYICGPNPMMESLVPALEDWGVPDARIHFEAFGPASVKRRSAAAVTGVADEAGIVVNFAKSGKVLSWRPASGSLLEFAEANGIAVDSGCRAGGCGSCQTTIQAGEVAYSQAPDFDPEPGSCLLCVCTPKSNVTLEA